MSLVQRIINELDKGPQSVNQLSVGVSGVYLRSMLNALVELGMVSEHKTWPRTYSLKSKRPDEFKPAGGEADEVRVLFETLISADLDKLTTERVTQHIVKTVRTAEPEDLLNLKVFMEYATAKITDILDNLETVNVEDIVIVPLKARK